VVENILVAIVVAWAMLLIGIRLWRMRCLRKQKAQGDCQGCPGCK